ncbi:MAG: hypothetical protein ABI261_01345 [Ginsengibacter sp.]
MKIIFKYFLAFILLFSFSEISFAQDSTIITKVSKFKPPVVKTFLGTEQNGAQITADKGNELIGLPLKIIDDKNNFYEIDSYQFLYKKKGSYLDDETGKKEITFTLSADRFDSTPLPKVWVDNISGHLQSDEQLYFFDVVVKDKQGRRFFAPELKITIK